MFVSMSVARREWKSEAELRAWITYGARVTAFSCERERVPDLVIIHQPPKAGRANWRVIDQQRGSGSGTGWSIAMRSVIARAQLQFDLR